MPTTKKSEWAALSEQLENLSESPLYEDRINNKYKPVLGEGNLEAELFVSRFRHGKPFRCLSVIIALRR